MGLCLLHGNLQVPYWKLFGLLTQTSIFSTSFQMWHNRRKAFFRDCCPRSTSFNDTAIVRNFYPKKFWSRQTFHLLILCNCCCLLLFTIKLLILLLLFVCSEVRIFRENVILAVKISQVVHRAVLAYNALQNLDIIARIFPENDKFTALYKTMRYLPKISNANIKRCKQQKRTLKNCFEKPQL